MKRLFFILLMATMAPLEGVPAANIQTLSGNDNEKLPAFTVDGPWVLNWSARSEFPQLAQIEMRLYDATSGEFIGKIVETKGVGHGLKVFQHAGSYQVVVAGSFVEWKIEIQQIDEKQAARLKRSVEGKPSLVDSARRVSRRVPEGSFNSWRPQGDENLLLFDDNGIAWRVSFSPACPGLESATEISFISPADDRWGEYDSVMLDDGTQCYFHTAIPGVAR